MPTKIIVNCETGEHTVVELTSEEVAIMNEASENYATEMAIRQAEADAKAQARASALAKLKALGLSDEEIGAL
jgi:hypothetical protein